MKLVEAGDKAAGALPLTNLNDEATALLVACNSVMNALALQGAPINPRLLSDLTLFCRQHTGHLVPFQTLATTYISTGPSESTVDQLRDVAKQVAEQGASIGLVTWNYCQMEAEGEGPDAGLILEELGKLELKLERFYQFFGWSKQLVRISARNTLDKVLNSGTQKLH